MYENKWEEKKSQWNGVSKIGKANILDSILVLFSSIKIEINGVCVCISNRNQ